MRRRALLQSLLAAAGAGAVVPFVADGHPLHDHLHDGQKVAEADAKASAAPFQPALLDRHQLQTLEILAERIVPGSTEARVAPFLDSLLSVAAAAEQRRFLGTLGAFEMLAIERYQRPWKGLTPDEQDLLLTEASTPRSDAASPPARGAARGPRSRYDEFLDLRGWIAGAYYSSEIGLRELGWTGQMVFAELPGCTHPEGHAD